MNIKPLSDRVVIKLVEAEEKTQSGIILMRPPTKISATMTGLSPSIAP